MIDSAAQPAGARDVIQTAGPPGRRDQEGVMIRPSVVSTFFCVLLSGTSPAQPLPQGAQAQTQREPGLRQPGDSEGYVQYGHPEPATLREIANGRHARQAVRTRGALSFADATSGYLRLTDGSDQVLVIVVPELQTEVRSFVGLRVEVVGLPRALTQRQGTCLFLNQSVPQSICDDPQLPATPDLAGRPFWPQMSLTIWSIADVTPLDGRRRGEEEALPTLRELLDGADTPPREHVIVRGRFCGRDLCGGLAAAPPTPEAWVLEREGAAVWVVGKSPQGKGWRLDPRSSGDTSRWLEVRGRLETRGGTRCLHADSVLLVRGPDPSR
jgi:hypothetical protein